MKLKIGEGLALPLEAVTETFAILGRRGSGKTHTAVVMAEAMLAAGVPVVVIDPLDVWWGLRVSKDGKKAGFPIYVCGGAHQDIPLTPDAGKVLADAIVDRGLSMVLSLRHLSKSDQRRFAGEFCERLYDRKADPKHRTALHVFIDEADAFVPQRLMPGAERCFGAVDTMVRRGRSSGLAVTLISQRPQVINKDVLSQTEVLVAHQLTGPQDRKALEAWIEANDTENRRAEFMGSLASLRRGTAWFWSPGLLEVFKPVQVRDRDTFDSSATPKAGVTAVASPKAFAAVDLERLTAEIAATIEKAKADDPRELRKQIADLKRQVAQGAPQANPKTEPICQPKVIEKFVLKDGQLAAVEKLMSRFEIAIGRMDDHELDYVNRRRMEYGTLTNALSELATTIRQVTHTPTTTAVARPSSHARREAPAQASSRPARVVSQSSNRSGDGNGRDNATSRILAVLKQFPGANARRVGALAGVSPKLSTFRVAIAKLRANGWIDGDRGGFTLTDDGAAAAAHVPLPPTGEEAIEHWRRELGDGASRILFDALVEAYPEPLSAERVHQVTGIDPAVSTFRVAVAKLRNLELVDGDRKGFIANPSLFD